MPQPAFCRRNGYLAVKVKAEPRDTSASRRPLGETPLRETAKACISMWFPIFRTSLLDRRIDSKSDSEPGSRQKRDFSGAPCAIFLLNFVKAPARSGAQ